MQYGTPSYEKIFRHSRWRTNEVGRYTCGRFDITQAQYFVEHEGPFGDMVELEVESWRTRSCTHLIC